LLAAELEHIINSMDESTVPPPSSGGPLKLLKNKRVLVPIVAVLVAGLGIGGYFLVWHLAKNQQGAQLQSLGLSADAQKVSQQLSNGYCSGIGSKKLGSAPFHKADLGVVIPYGLMVQAHVTPIDHQYYYPINARAPRDTYDVLAPGDGTISSIEHRTEFVGQTHPGQAPTDDWRVVIVYSCSFFSYYDLMTSLDPSVKSQMPSDWDSNGHSGVNIPVKQGQVVGKLGNQSLDFAVWDLMKKPLSGLLVPVAYDAEPWKPYTAPPLDYFSDEVKAQILPHYIRTVEPLDGKIDYDLEGKLIGNWFRVGTNGYTGSTDPHNRPNYWENHLAFVYNNLDPRMVELSLGNFGGQAVQYAVKGNSPDPAKISQSAGMVKYEVVSFDFDTPAGQKWDGQELVKPLVAKVGDSVLGTVLVQLTGAHQLKAEMFPGKSAAQVSGFTSKAVMYNRGDDAKGTN